jgi:hypothetical protein
MSQRFVVKIHGCPPPSNISSNMEGFYLQVIPHLTSYGCKIHQIIQLKTQVLPLVHIFFRTTFKLYFPHIPFNVFKYHSTKYIHRVWIGSHNSNSSTKWTNKCVMISKHGGNFRSSNINVIIASFFNSPIMARSTTLAHSCLKTWHNQMIAIL